MSGRPKKLAAIELDGTLQTLYTVPASKYTIVTLITPSVQDEKKVDLWFVPNAASPNDDNQIWHEVLPLKETSQEQHGAWVMETGGTIQAQCEVDNAITLRIDGIEVDV